MIGIDCIAPLTSCMLALSSAGIALQEAREPPPPVTLLVPWSPDDAQELQAWLRRRDPGGTFEVHSLQAPMISGAELPPNVVLLGYFLLDLERLRDRGLIEDLFETEALDPQDQPMFRSVFQESWTLAQSLRYEDQAISVDAFADLINQSSSGTLLLRPVHALAPEALILAQVALILGIPEGRLHELVLVSPDRGTMLEAVPVYLVLGSLPPGCLTFAPLREIVRARLRGELVTYALPNEGLVSIEQGAGVSLQTSPEVRQWAREFLSGEPLFDLCRELDLEPVVPWEGPIPEWIERLQDRRHIVDLGKTQYFRELLSDFYQTGAIRASEEDSRGLELLIDWLLLFSFVGFLLYMLRRKEVRSRA
jgi:hypothetical protein